MIEGIWIALLSLGTLIVVCNVFIELKRKSNKYTQPENLRTNLSRAYPNMEPGDILSFRDNNGKCLSYILYLYNDSYVLFWITRFNSPHQLEAIESISSRNSVNISTQKFEEAKLIFIELKDLSLIGDEFFSQILKLLEIDFPLEVNDIDYLNPRLYHKIKMRRSKKRFLNYPSPFELCYLFSEDREILSRDRSPRINIEELARVK